MLRRLLMLIPIVLAAAACETTSEEAGAAGGGGSVGGMPPGAGAAGMPPSSATTVSSLPAPSGARGSLGAADAERELVSTGDTVYFAFDSYALDPQAQETLDRQAAVLLRGGGLTITIEGHTDERGTREYNLALGERRATAVKDYLVAFGIPPSRIRTLSYGEERPAVVGSNEQAWARNRRAVTIVVGGVAGS